MRVESDRLIQYFENAAISWSANLPADQATQLTDLGRWALDHPLAPDPYAVIAPGEVPDLFLNVSLDGSKHGQLVIISYTWLDESGQPTTPEVPCPTNETLQGAPSPCDFHVAIFAYDVDTGWTDQYDEDIDWAGLRQGLRATSIKLKGGNREVLILTSVVCAGHNCPFEDNVVLAMKAGKIETVAASQTILGFGSDTGTVTLANRVSSADPVDPGLAFSNGRLIRTVGLDPATGEVAVIAAKLSICANGTLGPRLKPDAILVSCDPGNVGGYVITDQTVVEPASIGGLAGLQEGMRVLVEYVIKECADLLNCDSPTLTPVATRVTVLPAGANPTYVDDVANIAFDYPASWIIHGIAPGFAVSLQSYPLDLSAPTGPTRGLPPGATKCEFIIMPDGTIYEQEVNNYRATRILSFSEQQWELAGGIPAVRFQAEEPLGGVSATLITEINGRIVYFTCGGELAPFDGIVRTLRPAP